MSDWRPALAALRSALMSHIDQKVIGLFGFTLSANSSAVGDKDYVETGDGENSQRAARRIEPFGLRSRRPSGVRSLWLKLGSSNIFFIGVASNTGYGPTDLDDGEVALYCTADGTVVLLDKDGNLTLKSATGKKVFIVSDITGGVELGPDGGPNDQVLIKGSMDGYGIPITQAPAFSTTTVKAG